MRTTSFRSGHGGEEFTKLLNVYSDRLGLSATALGDRAGIDSSYISRLKRRERATPSVEIVDRLARAFGLTRKEWGEFRTAAGFWPDMPGGLMTLIQQMVEVLSKRQGTAATMQAVLEVLGCAECDGRDLSEYEAVVASLSGRYLASVGKPVRVARRWESAG